MSETIDRIFETYFAKKREIEQKYKKLRAIVSVMEKKHGIKDHDSIESDYYVTKKYENEMKDMKDKLWEEMMVHYDLIVTFLEEEKRLKRRKYMLEEDDVLYGYVPDYVDDSVFFEEDE